MFKECTCGDDDSYVTIYNNDFETLIINGKIMRWEPKEFMYGESNLLFEWINWTDGNQTLEKYIRQ